MEALVIAPDPADAAQDTARTEALVVLGLAVAAAVAVKVPELFGVHIDPDAELPLFYFRNATLFVFPLLTLYFVWKRRLDAVGALWLALPFAAGAVFANAYPWKTVVINNAPKVSDTALLTSRSRWDGGLARRTSPSAGQVRIQGGPRHGRRNRHRTGRGVVREA